MKPGERRELAQAAVADRKIAIRRSCRLFTISEGCYRHVPDTGKDSNLEDVLLRLAATHIRWGFGLMYGWIRNQGYTWNHKRVYRVYKRLKLNLRIKPKKRLPNRNPTPLAVPIAPNECWSLDFMSDSLSSNDSFRVLNIIDDFNREYLHAEIDRSLPAARVIRALEMAIEQYGKPRCLRSDNGPEFISQALAEWASDKQITLNFIKPGKPTQNAFVERFNKTYREEILDLYLFRSLSEVQDQTTDWMWTYNRERSHKSLGGQTPWQHRRNWMASQAVEAVPRARNTTSTAC